MKLTRTIYHFFGGIYFALILITAVTFFVIAGTLIESITQSHLYAALFTYDNPIFAALLWGFFINILFSATRRWPFRWKHIPFLTTHLGLLMILAGVLAKHYFGLQGSILLSEGSSSHEVMDSNTYAVQVVEKKSGKSFYYPIQRKMGGAFKEVIAVTDNSLTIRLVDFYPHSKERLVTWVKRSHAVISGLKPIPLHIVSNDEEKIPLGGKAKFYSSQDFTWDLFALKTSDVEKTLSKLYKQNAHIKITARKSQEILFEKPMEDILKQKLENSPLSVDLLLNFSHKEGFQNPLIKIVFNSNDLLIIPLNGNQALLNLDAATQKFIHLPIAVDIHQQPLLAIIEDESENIFLVAFDPHGKVWMTSYPKGHIDRLIAYEDGFSGYSVQEDLPVKIYPPGRQVREEALGYQLKSQLHQAVAEGIKLSPPLQLMLDACKKAGIDFSNTTLAFLTYWNDNSHLLDFQKTTIYPPEIEALLYNIDWQETPPLVKQAEVLSSYLRSYGIDLAAIFHIPSEKEMDQLIHRYQIEKLAENLNLTTPLEKEVATSSVTIETMVFPLQQVIAPSNKLEDNIPKITLFVNKGEKAQSISLAYDRNGSGLMWPILNGEYKVRFQPLFKEIPYHLRLRQARQINYANSSQPFSFESNLIFNDRRTGVAIEKTISMNNVHETWDGYRFYLSSITPPDETAMKHVQIAVNYDPAKYILTYPGAIVLSCGIFMLFIMRPYRRSKT